MGGVCADDGVPEGVSEGVPLARLPLSRLRVHDVHFFLNGREVEWGGEEKKSKKDKRNRKQILKEESDFL